MGNTAKPVRNISIKVRGRDVSTDQSRDGKDIGIYMTKLNKITQQLLRHRKRKDLEGSKQCLGIMKEMVNNSLARLRSENAKTYFNNTF